MNFSSDLGSVEQGLQKKAKRNLLSMQKGEILETSADSRKAKAKLGFSPKALLNQELSILLAGLTSKSLINFSS